MLMFSFICIHPCLRVDSLLIHHRSHQQASGRSEKKHFLQNSQNSPSWILNLSFFANFRVFLCVNRCFTSVDHDIARNCIASQSAPQQRCRGESVDYANSEEKRLSTKKTAKDDHDSFDKRLAGEARTCMIHLVITATAIFTLELVFFSSFFVFSTPLLERIFLVQSRPLHTNKLAADCS